jgi:hypothetical protein
MGFKLDESGWPIVVAHWQGPLTDDELTLALGHIDRWLARRQRFALLMDSRGAGGMSPEARARLVTHMKENAPLTSRYLVQASVVDSMIQRTLFFAVNLLFPNPFPAKVFSDMETARAWVEQQLAEGTAPE